MSWSSGSSSPGRGGQPYLQEYYGSVPWTVRAIYPTSALYLLRDPAPG